MEIKCNSKVSFKLSKELCDIILNKQFILKNKKMRLNIFLIVSLVVVFWLLLTFILAFFNLSDSFYNYYSEISSYVIYVPICILVLYFITIFNLMSKTKNIKSSSVNISKQEISDSVNGLTINAETRIIQSVVIGKHVVCILLDSDFIFSYPIKYKKEILNALNKELPEIKQFYYSTNNID